jgi:hypothetical protein
MLLLNPFRFGAAAPFAPTDIAGLQLWLDASDDAAFDTGVNGGAAVANWFDKSGNARTFTQATAADKPSREDSVQNGKRGVLFQQSNTEYMLCTTTLTNFIAAGAYTLFMVVKNVSVAAAGVYIALFGDTGLRMSIFNNGDAGTVTVGNNDTQYLGETDTTGLHLIRARHDAGALKWQLDAGSETSLASGNTTTLTNAMRLGRSEQDLDYYDGYILEALLYNVVVASGDRTSIFGYLNSKWALGL